MTTGIDGLYEYDAIGNNTLYQMGNITDTMVYNHFGQVDKVTRTKSGTVSDAIDYTYDSAKGLMLSKETDEEITSYAYNSLGSVTSITSPSGLTRIYTRDSLDRISSVSADNKNFTYEYYGDGQIKKVTYPNTDITAEYTYDNANRMTSVVTKKGTSIIYNCQYTYDNANNIISVTGTETANYTYDSLNRLKTSTQNGVTTTYEYDSRNNLISETAPNFTKTYEYGGDNRLYKVCENGVDTLYEYDPNGNLIKRGNDEFAYDHENILAYSDVNGTITTYETGADGLRKSKTTEGVSTTYQWDENGNVICENGNEIISGYNPLAIKVDGTYYYYVYNGHGDVAMLIDEEGNVKNNYSYNAWGDISEKSETIDNPFTYYGQIHDEETGLYYLRARYYDPETKRFITEDPARDELNWYAYCGNNPINFVDPSGLTGVPCGEEVYLRDMFNMYKQTRNDNISVYTNRVVVNLNSRSQTYYYSNHNSNVHGNRMNGDRMVVNAVDFAQYFGVEKTAAEASSQQLVFAMGSDDIMGFVYGGITVSYNLQIKYVDTPTGRIVTNQSMYISEKDWNLPVYEYDAPLIFFNNTINLIQGNKAKKIRLDTYYPTLLTGKENEVYSQRSVKRTVFTRDEIIANVEFSIINPNSIFPTRLFEISSKF